jgi:AraC-like DNA-binding protein
MIEQFSTSRVRIEERLSYWNDLMAETYSGLVVDPGRQQFKAEMSRWYLGDLTMICPKSSAASVTRRPSQCRYDDQMVVLHIIQSGNGILHQRNASVVLKPGDMVVCTSDEEYRFDMASEHQVLVVEMERDGIAQRCSVLNDRIATLISGEQSATRLLHNYLLSLWREGAANFDTNTGDAYASILKEMFVRSLHISGTPQAMSRNALVDRMKGIVEARLHDCTLSTTTLADELGVSSRTLQNAMAETGATPVTYIVERRLQKAAQLLATDRHRNITEIAYACGFSDSAYFSRRFHANFGMAPSQYRALH